MSAAVRRTSEIPYSVLISAAALIAFTIATSLFAKVSGVGATRLNETRAIATLMLRFDDRADGAIEVSDATDGRIVYVVQPGQDGFIRGTVRGLAQARKRADIGRSTPFRLVRWSDGTLSLSDDADDRTVGLDAFGPDNAGAFAQFFPGAEAVK